MNTHPRINLPPPSPARRHVAPESIGSPLLASPGGLSIRESRSIEETLRETLLAYMMFLEHELQFLESEIAALIERQIGETPREEAAMLTLRNGLKVRYNTQSVKMARVKALLDVV